MYALPALQIAVGVSGGALLLGLLLLAVATLRAHVVPPVGAWLVILTVPLGIAVIAVIAVVFFIGTSQQGLLQALVGGVLGLGLAAWAGRSGRRKVWPSRQRPGCRNADAPDRYQGPPNG